MVGLAYFFTYNFLKQYLGKFLGYLVHDGRPILCCCKFDIKSKPGAAVISTITRRRLRHSHARRKASTYPTAYGDTLTPSRTKSNWGSTSASVRAKEAYVFTTLRTACRVRLTFTKKILPETSEFTALTPSRQTPISSRTYSPRAKPRRRQERQRRAEYREASLRQTKLNGKR